MTFAQMRHENNKISRIALIFSLLTYTHTCFCQILNNSNKPKKIFIIHSLRSYYESISVDSSQKMVNLSQFVKPFHLECKYATKNNFTGKILYKNTFPFVRLVVANALQKVQSELADSGLGLLFFDAYRPYSVTKKMWKIMPDERYAANPSKGSGHNRGAAIDVGLIHLASGKALPMPTEFDDFSEKAHHDYMQLSIEAIHNRKLLKNVMEKYGFVALQTEWWHYAWPGAAQKFALLDLSFRELNKIQK